MVIWCLVLFGLGAVAFLDTQYNYGQIFRQVNAVLFMAVSLALLYRITVKARIGAREALLAKIRSTEQEIDALKSQKTGTNEHQSTESQNPSPSTEGRPRELRTV